MAESARRDPGGRILRIGVAGILLFLVFPTLLVFPLSVGPDPFLRFPPSGFTLKWYAAFFADPDWRNATLFSLQVAALTTVAATVLGTMTSLALVRGMVPGRSIINALLLAPLVVPHIVVAVASFLSFAPLGLTGTLTGFVLAHTALSVPYVVLTVSASLHRLDLSLEMAAMSLGASRWTSFREVTMPLSLPGIAAGAVFAFVNSFDEAVVSFFLSDVSHKTITRKLFEDIDFDVSPLVAAASAVLAFTTFALMGGVKLLNRRGGSSTAIR